MYERFLEKVQGRLGRLNGGIGGGIMQLVPAYPKIANEKYHNMSFSEIDDIREKICSGEWGLYIKKTQAMLYLNQMTPEYRNRLKIVQNVSIVSLIAMVVFLFINWKISLILLTIGIASSIWVIKNSFKYIGKNCQEDRAFLKFALAVGLVEIQKPEDKTKN